MDPALLVVPGAVLGGLALAGLALRAEQQRVAALRALAQQQGWDLVARDDVWADAFEGEPFGRGHSRRAQHVLTGTFGGRDLVAFDYSCRTTSTDGQGRRQTRTHRFAVAALRLPVAVPLVELEASWLPRVLSQLFGQAVELESEEFNARYRVRADDPRLAYDLLPARTMQLLLDRPDLSLRLLGGCAVTWDEGRLRADELVARLDTVTAVLDAVPDWVWRDRA